MTDLSSLSNEELMAIAGVSPATSSVNISATSSGPDLSSYSNEELLKIAGMGAPKARPAWNSFEGDSFLDDTMGAFKGLAKGAGDLFTQPANLLYSAGNYVLDKATGTDTPLQGTYPSDRWDQFVNWLSGDTGNKTQEDIGRAATNIQMATMIPSVAPRIAASIPFVSKTAQSGGAIAKPLANIFSQAVGYGTEGAGYSIFANSNKENPFEDAGTTGMITAAIPGVAKVVGMGIEGAANVASDLGRNLESSAFGGSYNKIKRAIQRMPGILDEKGAFNNPISAAIKSFRAEGGGSAGMSGQTLLKEAESQIQGHAAKLGDVLMEAQAKQKNAIIPEFNLTREYVEGLAGTDKAKAMQMAEEEIANTINNTDGTLLSLQAEKVKLGKSITSTTWGEDAAGRMRNNILKRIRADLRSTVEDSYQSLTGKSKKAVSDLNEKIGQRQALSGLFEEMIARNEAQDPLKWIMQNLRTSGGFGAAMVSAAGAGAGSPLIAAIPLAGGMAATPTGRKFIGDALRANIFQTPARLAAEGVNAVGAGASRGIPFLSPGQDAEQPVSEYPAMSGAFSPSGTDTATGQVLAEPRSLPFQNVAPNPATTQPQKTDISSEAINYLKSGGNMDAIYEPTSLVEVRPMNDYDAVVEEVFPHLVSKESGGTKDPNKAVSPKGALGKAQIMPDTAKYIAKKLGIEDFKISDLQDPDTNEMFGKFYLKEQLERFNDIRLALAAYNAGPEAVKKWVAKWGDDWDVISKRLKDKGAYLETVNYVPWIMKRFEQTTA